MTAEDRRLIAELPPNLPLLIVHNKIDLAAPPAPTGAEELQISAATGAGVERLIDELHHRAGLQTGETGVFSARTRHVEALRPARARHDAAALRLPERSRPALADEERQSPLPALGQTTGQNRKAA